MAQEIGGQADIGFQQYYLSMGSQRVTNVSGLAIGYRQVIPNIGLLSASLSPALDNARFRTGRRFPPPEGSPMARLQNTGHSALATSIFRVKCWGPRSPIFTSRKLPAGGLRSRPATAAVPSDSSMGHRDGGEQPARGAPCRRAADGSAALICRAEGRDAIIAWSAISANSRTISKPCGTRRT